MASAIRIAQSPDSVSDSTQTTNNVQKTRRRNSEIRPISSIPSPLSSSSSDKGNRTSDIDTDENLVSMNAQTLLHNSEKNCEISYVEQMINDNTEQRKRVLEADDNSDDNYDPDQDIEERRIIRKGLRDLNKNLIEHRSEFMNPNSTGLEDTITQANNFSRQVKQTSDATIDSHLLVTAADITYKRTVAIVSGEAGQGVDLDDLINKCKAFMRQGDEERISLDSVQDKRIERSRLEEPDKDDEDEILNWEYLGRNACLQCINRPCVPGFILGPLSTEKKFKRIVARKPALKISSMKESRPEILREEDIVHDDDLNLSTMCQKITAELEQVRGDAITAAETETRDDMTDKEIEALLDKYNLSREGGVALFKFVINPHSFSQSVENLFYVSFLIRDGKMALSLDDRGMPYLELRDDEDTSDSSRFDGQSKKNQAVLALDMAVWSQLIELFDIKKSMIPHREDPEVLEMGVRGWYA